MRCRPMHDEGDTSVKSNYERTCRRCRPKRTRSHHYIDTADVSLVEKIAEGAWLYIVYMAPLALAYGILISAIAPE
jgi:hypothetical protein